MLIELENRCFLIDARRKLSSLYLCAQDYQDSDSLESEQQIRIIMVQLESALSTIHEYIAYEKVQFFIRYPDDMSMKKIRLVWKETDYVKQQPILK